MFKKLLFSLAIFSLVLINTNNVYALVDGVSYHKNSNGITLTEKEYQFVEDYYGNDYFDNMTQSDYDWIKDLNIDNSEVEIKESLSNTSNGIMPSATSISQYGKNLKIAKSCDSYCVIIVKCQWLVVPNIKSYDLIGARLYNTTLINSAITTKINYGSSNEYSSDISRFTNGFGVSVKLPSTSSGITVEQKYYVKKSGIAFASYQHATKNVSLETSKLYTIGNGYGSVFVFSGNAIGKYDKMTGVSVSLK